MSELEKQILERIINLLHEQNRKQIELTAYLKLNKNAFSYWKSGKSNSYKGYLAEIAEFFDVSIDFLVYGREYGLTKNETEMLELFRRLSEREQIKLIGRTEGLIESDEPEIKVVGQKIARRMDGEAVRTDVTEEEFTAMEQLPEETDF